MVLNFAELVNFLQNLIHFETLPGHEKPVIDLIQAEMHHLGYDQVYIDHAGNLIGIINGAKPGPTLLFDGHCDVVGIAPGAPWHFPPFGGVIDGERLYGRGTSDMKGALAAMVHAAAVVDKTQLAGRVVVSASVLEEVMEGVALKVVMDAIRPDYVVIGESTNLNLNHGGRGRAELLLEAIGRPAHSSTPHLGDNAVHKMVAAIRAIEAMPMPADPLLGPAVQALTDIMSEPYPGQSVIPSRCLVSYDRRLLPGETAADVLARMSALPACREINISVAQGDYETYTGAVLSGPKFFPAWKFAADHDLVQAALAGLQSAGLNPALGAYGFCTNAAYSAGQAGVPTIGFGPSTEGQAHVTDEYIELAQLEAAARGYRAIIESVLAG